MKKPNNPAPKFFETAEFKKLEATWKAKLKDSGFDDLEDDSGALKKVLRTDSARYRDSEAVNAYYNEASAALWVQPSPFESELQRQIWAFHCEGLGRREIADRVGMGHSWTGEIIIKIQKKLNLWHERPIQTKSAPSASHDAFATGRNIEDELIEKIDQDREDERLDSLEELARRIKLPSVRIIDRIKPKKKS